MLMCNCPYLKIVLYESILLYSAIEYNMCTTFHFVEIRHVIFMYVKSRIVDLKTKVEILSPEEVSVENFHVPLYLIFNATYFQCKAQLCHKLILKHWNKNTMSLYQSYMHNNIKDEMMKSIHTSYWLNLFCKIQTSEWA